jgi:hypothetical protein
LIVLKFHRGIEGRKELLGWEEEEEEGERRLDE